LNHVYSKNNPTDFLSSDIMPASLVHLAI